METIPKIDVYQISKLPGLALVINMKVCLSLTPGARQITRSQGRYIKQQRNSFDKYFYCHKRARVESVKPHSTLACFKHWRMFADCGFLFLPWLDIFLFYQECPSWERRRREKVIYPGCIIKHCSKLVHFLQPAVYLHSTTVWCWIEAHLTFTAPAACHLLPVCT